MPSNTKMLVVMWKKKGADAPFFFVLVLWYDVKPENETYKVSTI